MGNKLWQVFVTFLKIGGFTFGGGYAMIPLIQREAVERHGWVSDEDILEIIAIAESTPGPIAINAATFIGCRVAGVAGALAATLGVVLPSFVIILLIAGVLDRFRELEVIRWAFVGIRAGVLALIVKAMVNMYRKSEKSVSVWGIMLGVFVAVAVLKLPAIGVLICAALAGLVVTTIRGRKKA